MKSINPSPLSLLFFVWLPFAHSQESTSNATGSPVFETTVTTQALKSSSRTVLTQKEISESGAKNLVQLLTERAGFTVAERNFYPDDIYLRGGDAGHILFLVDGYPVYDAMAINRSFSLKSINLASIQKIEVLKGSQAILYGGQAMAGVVKIETISFAAAEKSKKLNLVAGDREVLQAHGNVELRRDQNQVLQAGAFYQEKNADSPVLHSSYKYPEKQYAGDVAWLKKLENDSALLLRARIYDEQKRILERTNDTKYFNAEYSHALVGASWVQNEKSYLPSFHTSYVESERKYLKTDFYDQDYDGRLFTARLEQPLLLDSKLRLISGMSYAKEEGAIDSRLGQNPAYNGLKKDVKQELTGVFLRGTTPFNDKTTLEFGYRYDDLPHDSGSNYQVGINYDLWRLEYATSIKAPTLFQKYDFQYGDAQLKPESIESITLERSLEISKNTQVTLAGFYSRYDDLINAVNTGGGPKYQNVAEAEISGFEGEVKSSFEHERWGNWDWEARWLYQDPTDVTRKRRLLYRPYNTFSTRLNRKWTDSLNTFVGYYYSGDRLALGATSTTIINLDPYRTVSVGAQWQQLPSLKWQFKANNVFDKRYQESYDFYSEGLSVTLGLEYEN